MMNKRQYDFVRLIEESVQTPRRVGNEILVWLYFSQLSEFTDLVGDSYFCEGGVDINLQDNCVVVDIKDILEYLEIDEDVIEVEG
jgi:hypothetical protein